MSLTESPRVVGPLPLGFPMPRDRALLDPSTPRVRVRTVADRFPFPMPNGWFAVTRSVDLAPGEVASARYFGRDLVLFRAESGEARVLDAYCPHLGAHLAVGGKVEGTTISCPFHGWRFEGETGSCVEIPYASTERIPSRAAVRTYRTVERNGLVFAWYHATDGEPFYDVPDVPEFADPEFEEPILVEFRISTSCQEMAENNHDAAHFKFVHGSDAIPAQEEIIDGPYKRVESIGLTRETFGLGLGVLRVTDTMTFVSATTPIGDDDVHVRWMFTAPRKGAAHDDVANGLKIDTTNAAASLAKVFATALTQDIPIWENKIYREHPMLTRGESGIIAHRNWAKQFYS